MIDQSVNVEANNIEEEVSMETAVRRWSVRLDTMPEHEVMVERLLAIYDASATLTRIDGMSWYGKALEYAIRLSCMYGYSLDQMVNLISVISPGLDWDTGNTKIPEILCKEHTAGTDVGTIEGLGSMPANLVKAQRILNGEDDVVRGNKVTRFARNIHGDASVVTVDGWATRMLFDMPSIEWKQTAISGNKCYAMMEAAFIEAANHVGIPAHMFQAVVWCEYRARHYRKSASYRKVA